MRTEAGRAGEVESLGSGPLDRLPVFASDLTVAELDLHGGSLFWDEVRRFASRPFLGGLVERILALESPPRVWLFLDEPGETAGRAAAALAAARELAKRQQSVLVIDGDDQHPDLTRWAGRWEEQGWIDLVRYGASLRACGVPLPWDGEPGRLLGVGSFCPGLPTRDEVAWLLSLLGTQADFVLVSVPLGPEGALWRGLAELRLLCWDRTTSSPEEAAAAVLGLTREGGRPDALIAFGEAGLDLLPPLEEGTDWAAEPAPAPIGADLAQAAIGAVREGGAGGAVREAPPADAAGRVEPDTGSPGAPPAPVAMAQRQGEEARPAAADAAAAPGQGRRRRLLRAAVVVVSALLLGAVGLMIHEFYPRPGNELSALAPPLSEPDITRPSAPPPTGAAPEGAPLSALPVAAPFDSGSAGRKTGAPEPAAREGGVPVVAESTTTPGTPQGTVARPDGSANGAAPSAAENGSFDPAPFRLPVGRGGWALHVQSLPDSALAQQQVAHLGRLGITAAARAVEIPGKGVWYRVCMGSFESREAARQALPGLLRKLSEGWGQVVRY